MRTVLLIYALVMLWWATFALSVAAFSTLLRMHY